MEAVRRIDAIVDVEPAINGTYVTARPAVPIETVAPLVAELEQWMREARAGLSRHAPVTKAMDYMLKRWDGFTAIL
jgi:hypothetical protein